MGYNGIMHHKMCIIIYIYQTLVWIHTFWCKIIWCHDKNEITFLRGDRGFDVIQKGNLHYLKLIRMHFLNYWNNLLMLIGQNRFLMNMPQMLNNTFKVGFYNKFEVYSCLEIEGIGHSTLNMQGRGLFKPQTEISENY